MKPIDPDQVKAQINFFRAAAIQPAPTTTEAKAMTYWKPEIPDMPEFLAGDELMAKAEDHYPSVSTCLPDHLCLEIAAVDGGVGVIKKRNSFMIGTGKTPEEEAEERAPWLVSVPVEPGDPGNIVTALHELEEKLLEVAGPDFLPKLRRQYVAGWSANNEREAIAALEWIGPEYKEGRTKKEWSAVAKKAVADAVADGAVPEGLFVKFSFANDYHYDYEIRPYCSQRISQDLPTGGRIDGEDTYDVLSNYLLKYCKGGWYERDDVLHHSQSSLRLRNHSRKTVDDRCDDEQREDWDEQVEFSLRCGKGAIPDSVYMEVINKAAPKYADFFKAGNPTIALTRLLSMANFYGNAEAGEVLEAVNAYLASGDPTPMRDLTKELNARDKASRKAKRYA